MSTTKPAIPVTNLKERIAALEQKNAEAGQRPTSPAPGAGGAPPTTGSALRDRIAKFEKKGAVPAPRGRFGLGAPPPQEAQVRRNGEFYGNRISQQLRMPSGSTPPSRSGSSIGFYNGSPDFGSFDNRRSFSMNSMFSDMDDGPDYTPLTSPTFAFPPHSPESVCASEPPESPPSTMFEVTGFKEPIKRAAPFSEMLQAARKAAEKGGGAEHINDPMSPTPFTGRTLIAKEQTPVAESRASPDPIDDSTTPTETPTTSTISPLPEISVEQAPEETPVNVNVIQPTRPPTIIVESPTFSPTPFEESNPDTPIAQLLKALAADTPLPEIVDVSVPSPVAVESDKPKTRNNKDLTLDVKKLEMGPPPVEQQTSGESSHDNVTPTTASYSTLLSPTPPSAMSSVFSGSSYSSGSSMIRPFSMIDISLAERVTPATSRGNVVFLPPSTSNMPRKSDLVYFPPTPTKDEEQKAVEEVHVPTQQPEEAPVTQPVTFTSVVHRKVRETPLPIPHPSSLVPQTPKNRAQKARDEKRMRRMTTVPTNMVPPSPTTNELASLIQNAVILETMVEKGELPTERQNREAERKRKEKERLAALAAEKARAAAEDEKKKRAAAEAAQRETEEEPLANKLRHTFLIPLSRARSQQQQQHRREASMSEIDPSSTKTTKESLSHQSSKSSMRDKSSRLAKASEIPDTTIPELPFLPSKSPSTSSSKSRFSSFRRLGSVTSVFGGGRPSIDVSLSEGSRNGRRSGSVTPPVNEFGQIAGENGMSWPSLSPKKSAGIGKAASFAEKMFSRSRKQSSGSTLSNASGVTSDSGSSRKAQTLYTLPPLPGTLSLIEPSSEYEERTPRRSTSLRSVRGVKNIPPPMNIPPVPHLRTESVPPAVVQSPSTVAGSPTSDLSSPGYLKSPNYLGFVPSGSGGASGASSPGYLKSPDYLGFNSMNAVNPNDPRPMSWMSVSSFASELPSPLFENDIFDAFPAVPAITPSIPAVNGHFKDSSMPAAAAAMTPSFDSAFLSTAIHLAGSRQAPKVTPNSLRPRH